MGFFSGVGNFFTGIFGGKDDEEEKKPQYTQQQAQPKSKIQVQQPKQQKQQTQSVSKFFAAPKNNTVQQIQQQAQQIQKPKAQTQAEVLPPPETVYAPRVELQKKIQSYQDPGVQDVNNYYANDLKVLNDEIAKGAKADQNRIAGIMQSLDNRKKELKKFHDERGKSTPFQTARQLEEIIKSTRGDHSSQNAMLQKFWDTVSDSEKDDFVDYLDKNGDKDKQTYRNLVGTKPANENRTTVDRFDFTGEVESIAYIKQRQEIADQALEYKDTPLDQLNNTSIQTYLDTFSSSDPEKQRDIMSGLDNILKNNDGNYSNNPDLQRKFEQASILKAVLEDSGTQRSNWKTNIKNIGRGASDIGGAMFDSTAGRIGQSIGAIAGDDPLADIRKDYEEGKLTDAQFNAKMAAEMQKLGWVPDGKGGWKENLAVAAGTAFDTASLAVPLTSFTKAAKAAKVAQTGKTTNIFGTVGKSTARELGEEAALEGVLSAGGSLRDGEFNAGDAFKEGVFGATIGAAAPVAGKVVGDGLNKFFTRGVDDVAALGDDVARAKDLETPAFQRKAEDLVRVSELTEQPAFIHKREIQAIMDNETQALQKFMAENPDLPTVKLEEAAEATKAKIVKLTDELKQKRLETIGVVDDQAKVLDETVEAQQATNKEVVEQQQAVQEQGSVAAAPKADLEAVANNPYNIDTANEAIDSTIDSIKEGVTQRTDPLSKMFGAIRKPANLYREAVDKSRDAFNDFMYRNGVASSNGLTASIARSPRLLFDKAFMKDASRLKVNTFEAGKAANAARVQTKAREFQKLFDGLPDSQVASQRLYQVLEDPKMLERMFGKGTQKLSIDDLLPEERVIMDKMIEINKVRNDIWFKVLTEKWKGGQITDEAFSRGRQNFAKFQDGMHSPRIYDFDLPDMNMQIKGNSNKGAFKKRKDIAEVSQESIDKINANPVQSSLFRLQTGLDELQRIDSIKEVVKDGFVLDAAPNKNFVKLEGSQYGSANGKYMDKQIVGEFEQKNIFNSNAGQATEDLVNVYRESIFGNLDRKIKKAKTVYSPGTFMGNLFSNPLFFNRGSGINAAQQAFNMAREVPSLTRHLSGKVLDQDILDMQRLGVKIGYTGEELVGGRADFRVIGEGGKIQAAKDITKIPTKIYGGTDDVAKVSIYKTLKRRGMDSETAALRTSQFTQDYGNTGRVISLLADSPVLGQPFARFVPELLRLTKNNIVYNPVGTFAGLYGLAKVQKHLTENSNETPEQRALRESAPGKVKIPFSGWVNKIAGGGDGDISLDFPIGDSAINAARALGFNFPQEPGVDSTTSLLKNIAPFVIPFTQNAEGDTVFNPQELVSSMLLRPLAEQVANEDFMGRSVDDPTNDVRGFDSNGDITKYSDELTGEQKMFNRARHLAMNWLPLSGETDAVLSQSGTLDNLSGAGELEKNQDYYGKDRSLLESVSRMFGVKVESNDQEAREKREDIDVYFNEDLPATQEFLRTNPDLRDAYWNIKDTSKDRNTLIKANDIISPEKWTEIKNDTSGRLLDFLGQQERRIHAKSVEENRLDPSKPIKPIDPIHSMPNELKNAIIDIKSKPTGDDEADDILEASSAAYREYKKNAEEYFKQNEAYYESLDFESTSEDNPRVKSYYDIEYPEAPPLIEEYFNIREQQGEDAAKAYSDAQGDALDEQFDIWGAQRLEYTNKKREIEGYPPITEEVWNNKTYGYKADKAYSSGGSGYGSGGGGSSGSSGSTYDSDLIGRLSNFTSGTSRYPVPTATAAPVSSLPGLFAGLKAGKGGRRKPTFGASSTGRG